jgi:hypothetical protein
MSSLCSRRCQQARGTSHFAMRNEKKFLHAHPCGSIALLSMMGHDPTTVVEVKVLTAHARPLSLYRSISLLQLTQTCLDFWATPRRYFFELLSQYCRCSCFIAGSYIIDSDELQR